MGHHINSEGQFHTDKYPDLAPDKIVLSFKDLDARYVLAYYAWVHKDHDPELCEDISKRLKTI